MKDKPTVEKERAKKRLEQFAQELRTLKIPTSPISVSLADFFAGAIENYLSEKYRTMDQALGLTGKRGVPVSKADEHAALARKIHIARKDGMSWTKIAEHLSTNRSDDGPDIRELRRIYDKHWPEIAGQEAADEMAAEMRQERQMKPSSPRG